MALLQAFGAGVRRIASSPALLLSFFVAEWCAELQGGSLMAMAAWALLAVGCACYWLWDRVIVAWEVWDRPACSQDAASRPKTMMMMMMMMMTMVMMMI